MSLLDSFQWAPGQGMLDTAKNTSFQAGAARDFAQTDLVNTENAAKQAELQDYISQSAKEMRETTRQAEIGKAKEQIANSESLSNYFKNNPDKRDEMTAMKITGDITKMQKGITDDKADMEHTFTSLWYDPVTGKANPQKFLAHRADMIKAGVGTEDELPSEEDFRTHPKEAQEALDKAGLASAFTQEQKASQALQKQRAADEMKQRAAADAASMQRTQAEIAARGAESEKDRAARLENLKLQLAQKDAAAKLRYEGVKYKADMEKANKAGKPLPLSQVGGGTTDLFKLGTSFINEDPLAEDIPSGQRTGAVTLAVSNAQQRYLADPRNAPSWYLRDELEKYIANEEAHTPGTSYIGIPFSGNLDTSKIESPGPNTGGSTAAPGAPAPAATTQEAPQGAKKISTLSPTIQQAYDALGNSPAGLKKKEDFRKQYNVIEG